MLKITYLQIPQLRFQNVQSSDRYFFLTTNKKTPEQGKHYKGNHGKGNSIKCTTTVQILWHKPVFNLKTKMCSLRRVNS